MLQQEQKNKELREILRKNVPSFSSDSLTKNLCEDALEVFGSLYPGQTLSLCMKIAQRVQEHQNIQLHAQKKQPRKSIGRNRKTNQRWSVCKEAKLRLVEESQHSIE